MALQVPSALPGEQGHIRFWLAFLLDAASKHAALGFFDCLRAEVEEYDVVVSTVSPVFIRSHHAHPERGNWSASIWKCERAGKLLRVGQRVFLKQASGRLVVPQLQA